MKYLILVLMLSGCAVTQLTHGGGAVRIINSFGSQDAESYKEIGAVECTSEGIESQAKNMTSCKNELRNRAAELGADTVVLESTGAGTRHCSYCVNMSGTAYRKK